MPKPIVVVDHDPAWATWFEQLRARIWPAVADVTLRIDRVGSIAVRGLAAKPIIDLDIVLADDGAVPAVVERLGELGYRPTTSTPWSRTTRPTVTTSTCATCSEPVPGRTTGTGR